MPKYTYKCIECAGFTVIHHSVGTTVNECGLCGMVDTLKKVPSKINLYKEETSMAPQVGSVVKEHIEETHAEIEELKEKLKSGWREND